jgi:hypothetical protein
MIIGASLILKLTWKAFRNLSTTRSSGFIFTLAKEKVYMLGVNDTRYVKR